MGTLIFAIALALVLGFAAHRASVCTVRAVAEIMSSASGSIFLSIGKSMLWAWALMIPVFALTPAAGTGLAGWSLTGIAVLGGFLFGLGAAVNGGCAYSTMARFVDGDGKMLATIIGFAVGIFCFATLAKWGWLTRPAPEPAWVGSLLAGKWARIWAGILACAFLAWALYEILRLWRTRAREERIIELILAPRYRLSTAAVMVGPVRRAVVPVLRPDQLYGDLRSHHSRSARDSRLANPYAHGPPARRHGWNAVVHTPTWHLSRRLAAAIFLAAELECRRIDGARHSAGARRQRRARARRHPDPISLCIADLHRARGGGRARTGRDASVVWDRSPSQVPERYLHYRHVEPARFHRQSAVM